MTRLRILTIDIREGVHRSPVDKKVKFIAIGTQCKIELQVELWQHQANWVLRTILDLLIQPDFFSLTAA